MQAAEDIRMTLLFGFGKKVKGAGSGQGPDLAPQSCNVTEWQCADLHIAISTMYFDLTLRDGKGQMWSLPSPLCILI